MFKPFAKLKNHGQKAVIFYLSFYDELNKNIKFIIINNINLLNFKKSVDNGEILRYNTTAEIEI